MADKVVLCKTRVKRGLEIEQCGEKLPMIFYGKIKQPGPCDNRNQHLLPFESGFCNSGWHEGENPTDIEAGGQPTCKLWLICPCECHVKYDKMFALAEMDRVLVYNSTYEPNLHEFTMPSAEERALAYAKTHAPRGSDPVLQPSVAPTIVPPVMIRDFNQTKTGRAARGQLESWVLKSCNDWLVDGYEYPCTPVFVSADIALEQGIDKPSTGAITAVWDKWAALGFAVIARKPVRFISYTDEGKTLGLEALKVRARSRKATPAQLVQRRAEG